MSEPIQLAVKGSSTTITLIYGTLIRLVGKYVGGLLFNLFNIDLGLGNGSDGSRRPAVSASDGLGGQSKYGE